VSLLTATISGQLLNPTQGASSSRVTIEAAAGGGRMTYSGQAILGRVPVPIQKDGTAAVTLPQVPQSGLLPLGAMWRLRIEGSGDTYIHDFTLTADTTWDQVIQTATTATSAGAGVSAVTVGASPWTYTNADHSIEALYIKGGTVSAVTKNSAAIFAQSNVSVLLNPGEAVTVTYSVAPTAFKDVK
jgi:hypothetical protein